MKFGGVEVFLSVPKSETPRCSTAARRWMVQFNAPADHSLLLAYVVCALNNRFRASSGLTQVTFSSVGRSLGENEPSTCSPPPQPRQLMCARRAASAAPRVIKIACPVLIRSSSCAIMQNRERFVNKNITRARTYTHTKQSHLFCATRLALIN
jgi:hypothetical protein